MDWDAFWAKGMTEMSASPSTTSRVRILLPLVEEYGRAGGSLLDAGCGTGLLLERAAALGRFTRLVGVDLSELPLEAARVACPSAELLVADICEQALDERFDLVTCVMTLDLVPDQARAARHLSEMLVPGGHLIVVVQHRQEYQSDLDRRHGVHRYDRASLIARLQAHGLTPVKLFSWGWPLYSLYYRVLDKSGAGEAGADTIPSSLRRLASSALPTLFRLDDLFVKADRGRVLFAVFRKT